MHGDPVAYFLTWTTYGSWLPGDDRGWVKYGGCWHPPDPVREYEAKILMTENACILTHAQRALVEAQIAETIARRGWTLHVVNCRSNHLHVVLSADVSNPDRIRVALKAWATRALKESSETNRKNWWSERGSIRYLNSDDDLEAAIKYVRDGQNHNRL